MLIIHSLQITCYVLLVLKLLPVYTLPTSYQEQQQIALFNSKVSSHFLSSFINRRQEKNVKLLSFDDHTHFLIGHLQETPILLKRQTGWTFLESDQKVTIADYFNNNTNNNNNNNNDYNVIDNTTLSNNNMVKGPYSIQMDVPSWGLSRISQRYLPLVDAFGYPHDAGKNVDIYIVDSGVDISNSDFEGRAIWGGNFVPGSPDNDENGHGTIIAGIAAGTSYGVAKQANIISVKCLKADGTGNVAHIIEGLHYILGRIQSKPHPSKAIINLSVVAGKSDSLNLAVDALTRAGAIVVAAAGNYHEGDDPATRDACNYSPASASTVISVGSTDQKDQFAPFSKGGRCVTILAPGAAILSDTRSNTTESSEGLKTWYSGTSYSAPHVSGVAALLLNQPGMQLNAVTQQLYSLATQDIIKNITQGQVLPLLPVLCIMVAG
ncbi:peptidase S8/S53 domain-containing protein [Chlamydoabsidia padenii]|nr:peptidase S8/S53 domain-containing protein [Chlamydoabsidia padenii]